jgi:hypothetical protein
MESHATRSFDAVYDRVKQAVMLETDRPHVLRKMIYVCRPAGTLSVPGVYGGLIDKIPFGASMNKGLTGKMGQTHVNRWTDDLLKRIQEGQIDRPLSSPIRYRWKTGPACTRHFATRRMAASRLCLNRECSERRIHSAILNALSLRKCSRDAVARSTPSGRVCSRHSQAKCVPVTGQQRRRSRRWQ